MIGTIDIKVNAANPNLSLNDFYSFRGTPSSLRIINVPKKIGTWELTRVYININYPDNRQTNVTCKKVGDTYVGTVQGSSVAGKSVMGYTVLADGIDENGVPKRAYVLGNGDVYVLELDGSIIIDDAIYYLHLRDSIPTSPLKGDVVCDGSWKIYTDIGWQEFGKYYHAGQGLKLEGDTFSLDGSLSSYLPLSGGTVGGDIVFNNNSSISLQANSSLKYGIFGQVGNAKRYFRWDLPAETSRTIQTIALRSDIDVLSSTLSAKVDGELITPTDVIPLGLYWDYNEVTAEDLITDNIKTFQNYHNTYYGSKHGEIFNVSCSENKGKSRTLVRNLTTGQSTTSENIAIFFNAGDHGEIYDGDDGYDDICVLRNVPRTLPTRRKTLQESFDSHLSSYAPSAWVENNYAKTSELSSKLNKISSGSYTETQAENNNASIWGVTFLPSSFGMKDGSYIKSFTIKTRLETATPQPTSPIYYKLVDRTSGQDVVLGVVAEGKLMTEWNTPIRFTFDRRIRLSANRRYYLMSYTSPTDTNTINVGVRLSENGDDKTIYYNNDNRFRPIMTVEFESGEVLDNIWNELDGVYTKSEVNALIQSLREELS